MQRSKKDLERLKCFIDTHMSEFSPSIQDFFKNHYELGDEYTYYFMAQLYTYLFNDQEQGRVYYTFAKYLKDKFPNLEHRTILEVASGYLPTLAMTINQLYDMKNPITCMDPDSMLLGTPNVVEKKEEFTFQTDISPYDLIITHCPYKAIDTIVDATIQNRKELCAQLSFISDGSSMSNILFQHRVNKTIERLEYLEKYGFMVESDTTDAYDITWAPVITVRKRER